MKHDPNKVTTQFDKDFDDEPVSCGTIPLLLYEFTKLNIVRMLAVPTGINQTRLESRSNSELISHPNLIEKCLARA